MVSVAEILGQIEESEFKQDWVEPDFSGTIITKTSFNEETNKLEVERIDPYEVYHFPTREELDEQRAKEEVVNIQNQTHGNKCGKCQKAVNQTPNPKAILRYCKFNGVMVSKFQTSCESFRLDNKPASAWEG